MRYLAILLALTLSAPIDARQLRSSAELHAFQRHNPCPSTGKPRGSCPGYQIDHRIPLKCGGPDKIENLQWLTVEAHKAKTRAEARFCLKPRLRLPAATRDGDSSHAD